MSDDWLKIGTSFSVKKEKKRDKKKKDKKSKKSHESENRQIERVKPGKVEKYVETVKAPPVDPLKQFNLLINGHGDSHNYRISGTNCVAQKDLYAYGMIPAQVPVYQRLIAFRPVILGFNQKTESS